MPTALQYQNLITASLVAADDSVLPRLQLYMAKWWSLYARKACFPEMRYWYVRREAIKFVMGCIRQQTDELIRTGNGVGSSLIDSHSDGFNLGQGTRLSTGQEYAEQHRTETKQFDANRATTEFSNSHDVGASALLSSHHDIGSGTHTTHNKIYGFSAPEGSQAAWRDHTTKIEDYSSVSVGASGYEKDLGIYAEDDSVRPLITGGRQTGREHWTLAASGSGLGANFQAAASHDSLANYTKEKKKTFASSDDERRHNTGITDLANGQRLKHNDNKIVFEANVSDASNGSGYRTHHGAGELASLGNTHGTSNLIGSKRTASNFSATEQASQRAEEEGLLHRQSTKSSHVESILNRYQQRFLHLQTMWDNATNTIKLIESQIITGRYNLEIMVTRYPDGICADDGNAFLIKNPCGIRGFVDKPLTWGVSTG